MPVFGHKIWVALIIVVGLQLVNTVAADGPPMDVSAVFTLKSFFDVWEKDKAPLLSCVTADKNTVITTHNIPNSRFDMIRLTGPAVNKTAEYNNDGRGWPRGVVCKQSDHYYHYDVTTPFRYSNDSYTPTKLSYTLDPDQDLVVDVDQDINSTNRRWGKVGGSDRRTNIINGRLTIPHQELETGIYHLSTTSSSFSLLVRECTSGLYGPPDCTKDCPECRNGGMCHPQTGYCVCPPGVMGSLCQTRCPHNMIGKDCTVRVPYTAGVAVCVPHPVGCTCLPGYQGVWCEEECNNGHFGADCQGDCECSEDDCDKATGFCNQGVPTTAPASEPSTKTSTAPGLSASATAPTIAPGLSASATAPTTAPGLSASVTAPTTAPGLSASATAPTTAPGLSASATAPTIAPGLSASATAPTIASTRKDNGCVVYQVIVGVMALVIVVVSVGVLCWCWWTKRNQRVAYRPTGDINEAGPSVSVALLPLEDGEGNN